MRVGLDAVRWAALFFASLFVLLPMPARADSSEVSVALYAEGADAEEVRAALMTAVPRGVAVTDPDAYKKALINSRHYGQMGPRLWVKSGARVMLLTRVRAANKRVKAKMSVLARARVFGKTRETWVVVVDEKGTPVAKAIPYDGDKPNAEALRAAVAPILATLAPAVEPEPEPAPEPPPIVATPEPAPPPVAVRRDAPTKAPEPTPQKPHGSAHRRFLVGARGELAGRQFGYIDAATRNLRPYDALAVPLLGAVLEAYPLLFDSVAVGVVGAFARSPAFESQLEDGRVVASHWMRIVGGVRAGLRVSPVLELGLFGRFEWLESGFDEAGRFDDQLPTTTYRVVRPGLDARVSAGVLRFGLEAGYLAVLSSGPLGDRFTGTTVHGIGGDAYAAVAPVRWLELRLGARYERLFYGFDSQPGDDFAAGAAYDQSFGAYFGSYLVF